MSLLNDTSFSVATPMWSNQLNLTEAYAQVRTNMMKRMLARSNTFGAKSKLAAVYSDVHLMP